MNLISKILMLPWNTRTYRLEQVILRLQSDLLNLQPKILNGDYSAAHIAREKLQELEEKNIEFINS